MKRELENPEAPQAYERDNTISVWLNAYAVEKERAFIGTIDRFIPPTNVTLLDVGCGIGLHTSLWHERGKSVTASDLSETFREYIVKNHQFPFIYMDVLNCTIRDTFDVCFSMAITTILHDESARFRTFEALGRLMHPGSSLVLVTPSHYRRFDPGPKRPRLHCLDRRDIGRLLALGLELRKQFFFSCSPRFLWTSRPLQVVGRCLERAGFHLALGARKVTICRKIGPG